MGLSGLLESIGIGSGSGSGERSTGVSTMASSADLRRSDEGKEVIDEEPSFAEIDHEGPDVSKW